ncbi:hypothetical protein DYE50_07450 [Treponema ruminis]|nr:hypothetical protein DYE50_07450 [Treponema ruminis]
MSLLVEILAKWGLLESVMGAYWFWTGRLAGFWGKTLQVLCVKLYWFHGENYASFASETKQVLRVKFCESRGIIECKELKIGKK